MRFCFDQKNSLPTHPLPPTISPTRRRPGQLQRVRQDDVRALRETSREREKPFFCARKEKHPPLEFSTLSLFPFSLCHVGLPCVLCDCLLSAHGLSGGKGKIVCRGRGGDNGGREATKRRKKTSFPLAYTHQYTHTHNQQHAAAHTPRRECAPVQSQKKGGAKIVGEGGACVQLSRPNERTKKKTSRPTSKSGHLILATSRHLRHHGRRAVPQQRPVHIRKPGVGLDLLRAAQRAEPHALLPLQQTRHQVL